MLAVASSTSRVVDFSQRSSRAFTVILVGATYVPALRWWRMRANSFFTSVLVSLVIVSCFRFIFGWPVVGSVITAPVALSVCGSYPTSTMARYLICPFLLGGSFLIGSGTSVLQIFDVAAVVAYAGAGAADLAGVVAVAVQGAGVGGGPDESRAVGWTPNTAARASRSSTVIRRPPLSRRTTPDCASE